MRSRPRRAERGRRAASLSAVVAWSVAVTLPLVAAPRSPLVLGPALWSPKLPAQVDVVVHGSPAEPRLLTDPRQWMIAGRDLRDDAVVRIRPEQVEWIGGAGGTVILHLPKLLTLRDASGADLLALSVYFVDSGGEQTVPVQQGGSRPRGGSEPRPRYVAARGPGDADVYLSGALTTAQGARPTYTADLKLSHGVFTASGARFDARFTLAAAQQTNLDPDAIQGAVSYRRPFASPPLDLRVDLLTGEYARQDDRFNLAAGVRLAAVPPSLRLTPRTFVALEPFAGFEAGRNLARAERLGDRSVLRLLAGASGYLVAFKPGAGLDRITLAATFTLRLPQTDEPYTETRDGTAITSLTQRNRPHLGADLAFQFKAGYGLSLQYRHGSLPPSFRRVEHRLALGFSVQLKRP